tara:strand:- start:168 stop:908 length:741 start_codon:yes stop_codon:yes gene_type:complete
MKTIKDAYEELNGDLRNTFCFDGDESFVFFCLDESGDYVCSTSSTKDKAVEQYICTVEEFNNYKPEQENKVDYISADFWKDAPDGYGYWLEHKSNPSSGDFCRLDKDGSYYFDDGGTPTNIDSWLVVPRPKSLPVFTQEMADNGVLPSVGMECLILDEVHKVLLLPDDTRAYVTLYEGEYFFNTIDFMKPLTPPITLIDGKAYQFEHKGIVWNGLYIKGGNSLLYSQGNPHTNLCTNIKPLTVEVK